MTASPGCAGATIQPEDDALLFTSCISRLFYAADGEYKDMIYRILL
jgi:hypothetical protein